MPSVLFIFCLVYSSCILSNRYLVAENIGSFRARAQEKRHSHLGLLWNERMDMSEAPR